MQEMLITVVDFGSKKLSASLGKGTEIEIIANQSVPSKGGIKKGIVEDIEICSDSLKELLKKLEWISGERIEEIHASISSRNLKILENYEEIHLQNSKVEEKDKREVIKKAIDSLPLEENEEIVDYIVNFYTLDEKLMSEDVNNFLGERLKVNITFVIGLKENLHEYREIVKKAGYKLKGFIVNIISSKNIFLYGKKSVETQAIVDVGAEITDIAVFNNGVLKYISSIPLGGENITRDLSICGTYSMVDAENLKNIYSKNYETMYKDRGTNDIIEVGSEKVSKELFYEVIQARIEEILKYINLELKKTSFYEGICSIIIYGDGIVNYENVIHTINQGIEKKCRVITKTELCMESLRDISSLAGVKEVYDRLTLIDEKQIEKSKDDNKDYVKEIDNEYEKPKGFIKKVKDFLMGRY